MATSCSALCPPESDGLERLRADVAADPLAQAAYEDAARRTAVSSALQSARRTAQLLQGDVANVMGTTQSAVSEFERGRGGEPKLQTMQRYARAVNQRLDVAVVDPRWPVYDEQMAQQVWRTVEHMILSPLLTALVTERKRDRTLARLAEVVDVDPRLVGFAVDSLRGRGWITSEVIDGVEAFSLGEKAAYVIGLSLERDSVVGVLVNLQARVIFRREFELTDTSYPAVLDAAVDVVRQLYARRGPHQVVGVGVSVAGVVATDTGTIKFAPDLASDGTHDGTYSWRNVPFEGDLQAALQADLGNNDLRVIVENDANALALYQYLRHAARSGERNRDSCVTVILLSGAGIGAGLIYGGHIIHGANSAAGEGGHAIIERDGKPCRARLGHQGCLETVASAQALLQRLGLPADTKTEVRRHLAELDRLAKNDAAEVREALHNAGAALGRFIGGVITTNDPGRIAIYANDELVETDHAAAEVFQQGVTLGIDEYTAKDDGVERPTELHWKRIKRSSYAAAAAAVVTRQFLYNPERWAPWISASETSSTVVSNPDEAAPAAR
jgi:predicted NBD/HSP70 family sugar kinase/transcriptional regulator with XRE-family HTH domain